MSYTLEQENSKDCITIEQIKQEESIVKQVDKYLVAERIAIEVKAHLEVFDYFHLEFKSYLISAKDEIIYSESENHEILELAKEILKNRYKISILSEAPFQCVSKN